MFGENESLMITDQPESQTLQVPQCHGHCPPTALVVQHASGQAAHIYVHSISKHAYSCFFLKYAFILPELPVI